jgi:Peptidase family M28
MLVVANLQKWQHEGGPREVIDNSSRMTTMNLFSNAILRYSTVFFSVLAIVLIWSPHPVSAREPYSEEALRNHVTHLAGPPLEGRGDSSRKLVASELADHFAATGLGPLFVDELGKPSYFQVIPDKADETGHRPEFGRNVGAILPGSDADLAGQYVIIGVHYDHLGMRNGETYYGADDNATGVAMLLELSRRLAEKKANKPKRSIVFIAFDLEERMLWGSRWFASHPPIELSQVQLFVTADMIGRSLGNLAKSVVFLLGAEHSTELENVLGQLDIPADLEVGRLGIDLVGTRSDYGPFRDRQVPFAFFSTGEHPDYHTPFDTPDKVEYAKLANICSLVEQLVTLASDSDVRFTWNRRPEYGLNEPQILKRLVQILLEADKSHEKELTSVQRYLVTSVEARCNKVLEQGDLNEGDRAWLARMAQVLLLTVF